MLTPEYLQKVSEGAEEIAAHLHSNLINRIIERMLMRMGRGDKYLLTAADKWRIVTLQEAGYLLEDIQKDLQAATRKQEREIKAAMEEAGIKALDYDDAVYQKVGLSPMPLEQSPQLVRQMQRNYEAALGEWKNYTRTTATAAQNKFIETCDEAYNQVVSGGASYTEAVKEAVEIVAKECLEVTYPSGHTDSIETATARAVRTGIAQASGEISLTRMEEMDWDIILVSSHLGARFGDGGENAGNHEWWQGKFYSRTGTDLKFPPFSVTGFGTGSGLCGWNCRHSFGSGDGENNSFKQYDSEQNRKSYKLSQRQRELERRVRKTKREVVALQTAVDNTGDEKLKFELQQVLDQKSHHLQEQNKEYGEFCDKNRLMPLNDRLKIAEWNRSTAAKARGAARRYENAKA